MIVKMSDALLALARDLPPGIVPHLLRTCKTETKKYLSRRTVCTNFINFNLKVSKDTSLSCPNARK